jgi:hypothetical protein
MLIERAEAIAAGHDKDPAIQRRIDHAQRIVNRARMPGCETARSRYMPYLDTYDLPDLGADLFKRHKPAIAALVDEQGTADVLTKAAAVLKAFRSATNRDKGRMLMEAVQLDGGHKRAWAFCEGCGANERPEVLIEDLNVTSRLARWFQLYLEDFRIAAVPEGFTVSIRETDGALRIELHVEYFDMLGDALAGAMVIYFYARHARLTRAWLRDL